MFTKNALIFLMAFAIISMTILSSCSDDDSDSDNNNNMCVQSDWVGTYALEDSFMCPDSTIELEQMVTFNASSVDNTFLSGGDTIVFTNCMASFLGLINFELDGDNLSINALGCEAEYTRQ